MRFVANCRGWGCKEWMGYNISSHLLDGSKRSARQSLQLVLETLMVSIDSFKLWFDMNKSSVNVIWKKTKTDQVQVSLDKIVRMLCRFIKSAGSALLNIWKLRLQDYCSVGKLGIPKAIILFDFVILVEYLCGDLGGKFIYIRKFSLQLLCK